MWRTPSVFVCRYATAKNLQCDRINRALYFGYASELDRLILDIVCELSLFPASN